MTDTQTQADQTTSTERGFSLLPCPRCGESGSCIQIDLHNLTGDEAVHCCECNADFGLDDVRNLIERWSAVLRWVDAAPEL